MTVPILTAGLLLGLDSLAVSFAVGASPGGRPRRWLPLAFALCDGLAYWAGAALGPLGLPPGVTWVGPAAVAGYGLYVLAVARTAGGRAATAGAWLALAVPACLSLDNLVAGATLAGPVGLPAAAVVGAISGALALVGLAAGTALASRAGPRA